MLFTWLYVYIFGSVDIVVEGFFIERFINSCKLKNIIFLSSKIEKGTILRARIRKSDFKKIRHIAKKTSCKVALEGKNGLPFVLKRYRKRKVFAIAIFVIAFFCFGVTRFIWNIDVVGNEKISKEELLAELANYGIKEGNLKSNIDVEKIKNEISMSHDDLSFIGVDIEGTNVIVKIVEATEKPEIIDENTKTNIIADKSGVISKIVVRSGTARVQVGDTVQKGDILVEGIMEGKYTGIREVNSDADIFVKSTYQKEKKEAFVQKISERTGAKQKSYEIYLNNFKFFFNKGVSNFKKCDTIRVYKKVKLFSNYYIPVEIVENTEFELDENFKTYTEEELTEKIANELKEELNKQLNLSEDDKLEIQVDSIADDNGVTAKIVYSVEEKIGTKE